LQEETQVTTIQTTTRKFFTLLLLTAALVGSLAAQNRITAAITTYDNAGIAMAPAKESADSAEGITVAAAEDEQASAEASDANSADAGNASAALATRAEDAKNQDADALRESAEAGASTDA
jgi:hypothetical protein